MRRLALLTLASVAACAAPTFDFSERWETPQHGMVVSEHPLATEVGVAILERGGNAVDAAVATALALAVVYPQAGNLGGGGFALSVPHDFEDDPWVYEFRETAPLALRTEHFLDDAGELVPERSLESALGVGVPGTPAGLWLLLDEEGSMSFWEVSQPAIRLAKRGFPVDARLAKALADEKTRRRLCRAGAGEETFYPEGAPLKEGALLVQPELARTLERLARGGPDAFYEGEVADALAAFVRGLGGVLTADDLASYRANRVPPLRGWFRGLEVLTAPPPSSGGLVLLQILSVLDGFPLDEDRERMRQERRDQRRPLRPGEALLSGRALHWWVEAMRLAYADRAQYLGDPEFGPVPVAELLAPELIAQRRVSIGELANPVAQPSAGLWSESGETTHISVLDEDGNACSLTTTLNGAFGCGMMVPELGFLLNNEIDDFAILPRTPNAYGLVGGRANRIEPRKRPLSSMTPTVVRDGGKVVRMVLGSPGGAHIISSVLQVFLRVEVYGQGLRDAVVAPRLHQQWNPPITSAEPGWDPFLLQRLRDRHHEVDEVEERWASVQAIHCELGGKPVGVSDPRRGGTAQAAGDEIR